MTISVVIPVKVTVEWRCPHCRKDFTDIVEEMFTDENGDLYFLLKCGLCDREYEGESRNR